MDKGGGGCQAESGQEGGARNDQVLKMFFMDPLSHRINLKTHNITSCRIAHTAQLCADP